METKSFQVQYKKNGKATCSQLFRGKGIAERCAAQIAEREESSEVKLIGWNVAGHRILSEVIKK